MDTPKINKSAQAEMQQAFNDYKQGKDSFKEFYPCSQELSKWLQERKK
jgi:hypothetical protein